MLQRRLLDEGGVPAKSSLALKRCAGDTPGKEIAFKLKETKLRLSFVTIIQMTIPNESEQPFLIREAVKDDIQKLTQLHVTTRNATHPKELQKPTYERREYQRRQAFATTNHTWFCFVIETQNRELVGFAKGLVEKDGSGNLNKLYLLENYKKQGLGCKLLCMVAKRFYAMDVKVMWVATNPENSVARTFYERFEGIIKPNTEPGIAVYVWRDLRKLITGCEEPKSKSNQETTSQS